MTTNDFVDVHPGRPLRLSRFVDGGDIAVVTGVALDALDVLRSSWEPLSVEALLFALDGTNLETCSRVEIAHPHRLLVKASIDPGIRVDSIMIDPVVTAEVELSRRAIEAWINSALRDVVTEEGQHGEWSNLFFQASRVWVGPADWRPGETEAHLREEVGTVIVPLERTASGTWLSGPREPATLQPPIEISLSNEYGSLTLRLTRHYGYWSDPNEPAAQRLDELIERLREMGWEDEP